METYLPAHGEYPSRPVRTDPHRASAQLERASPDVHSGPDQLALHRLGGQAGILAHRHGAPTVGGVADSDRPHRIHALERDGIGGDGRVAVVAVERLDDLDGTGRRGG